MANDRSAAGAVALSAYPNLLTAASDGLHGTDQVSPAAQPVKTHITLPDGTRIIDDYGANGTTLADQRIYDAAGNLVLFKLFNPNGTTLRSTTFNADGSTTTAVYAGSGLLSKTFTQFTDGTRSVDDYNASGVYVLDRRSYDATGTLTSFTRLGPNGHTPVVTETAGTPAQGADLLETGTVAFTAAAAVGPHTVAVSFDAAASGTATALGTLVPVLTKDTAGGGGGLLDWTYAVPASQIEFLSVGQSLRETFDVTLTDAHDGTLLKPVTVTLVGSNDVPQAAVSSGDSATGAVSDTPTAPKTPYGYYTATGTLSFTDPDLKDVHDVSSVGPDYSKPTLGSWSAQLVQDSTGGGTGRYTWTYQISLEQLQTLAPGETATQDFQISVTDNHGATLLQTVSILLTGTADHAINHAPDLAFGPQSEPVIEAGVGTAGAASATIQVTASDRDPGDSASLLAMGWTPIDATHVTRDGTYGSAVLDLGTGALTYTLDDARAATNALAAGQTASDSFAVTDRDTHGLTTTGNATFSVTGTDDAPVFVSGVTDASFGPVAGIASGESASFSPDSSKIVYVAREPGLGASESAVFIADLATGAVTSVSAAADGTPVNGSEPAFTSDGSKVVFLTTAPNLLPSGAAEAVVTKDLATGAVTPVLSTASAPSTTGAIGTFALSPDGTKIAFDSDAPDLVPDDTNGTSDVFVKDLATGAVTRVSTTSAGVQFDTGGSNPVWSPDGTEIMFSGPGYTSAGESYPPVLWLKNLTTGALASVGAGIDDVFSPDGTKIAYTAIDDDIPGVGAMSTVVHDLATGATIGLGDVPGGRDGDTFDPAFLPDSTSIAFDSNATNLVPNDTNGPADTSEGNDVFIQNLLTGAITRVSTAAGDMQADGSSSDPVVSRDGTELIFRSDADNLVPGNAGSFGFYLKDIADTLTATPALAVTDDGSPATASVAGRLLFTDAEASDSHTLIVTPVSGDLGLLTATEVRDSLGHLTGVIDLNYRVSHATAAAALASGQTKTDSFTVTVNDGQGGAARQAVSVAVTEAGSAQAAALGSELAKLSGDPAATIVQDHVGGAALLFPDDTVANAKLDHLSAFNGTVQGYNSHAALDLGDLFGATSIGSVENASRNGGTLTANDDTHQAANATAGTYAASPFHASSDGIGGTLLTLRG